MSRYVDLNVIKDAQCILSVSGESITEKDIPFGAFYLSRPPKRIVDVPQKMADGSRGFRSPESTG